MDVVVVYPADVGVGDDDIGQVSEGLNSVGETNREQGESKVGRSQK